jgi:copper chaperone CopZ
MTMRRFAIATALAALMVPACARDRAVQDSRAAPRSEAASAPAPTSAPIPPPSTPLGAASVRLAAPSAELVADIAPAATDDDGALHRAACGAAAGEPGATCGQPGSGCDQWDDDAAEVSRRAIPANAVWKTWEVEGMHCGGCERRVIAHVGQVTGVVAVKANAGTGRVSVAVATGDEPRFEAARERIASLGYRVGDERPSL